MRANIKFKENNFLSDEILVLIFQLFSISDLGKVPLLSRKWKDTFNQAHFWSEKSSLKNLTEYLLKALFNAIILQKHQLVIHYCKMDVNIKSYLRMSLTKKYSFFDVRYGFFLYANPLTIAANRAVGSEGKEIVKTLLKYKADPNAESIYLEHAQSFFMYSSFSKKQFGSEKPAKSANNLQVRELLLLSEKNLELTK